MNRHKREPGRRERRSFYFVVLFDVIRSQKIEDRQLVTTRLRKGIRILNARFGEDIYAPLEITRGDEVAAVLSSITGLFEMFGDFRDIVYPVRLRMAVSYGALTAGL